MKAVAFIVLAPIISTVAYVNFAPRNNYNDYRIKLNKANISRLEDVKQKFQQIKQLNKRGTNSIDGLIKFYAKDLRKFHPKPEKLLRAVVEVESSFNPKAVRKEKAFIGKYRSNELGSSHGLMQIMGFNAKKRHVNTSELSDSETNIMLGINLLHRCFEMEAGDELRALACNNQGPEKQYNQQAINYANKIIRIVNKGA